MSDTGTAARATTIRMVSLLVVAADGDEFVVGRHDLGIYVAVPEPGAVFITALQEGVSLEEATARASSSAGAEVDGAEFLDGLASAGLLDPPVQLVTNGNGRRIRWIEAVSPRRARLLFGRVAWTVYGACGVIVLVFYLGMPSYRPTVEAFWFLPDPVLSLFTLSILSLGLAAMHEAWHFLAGRAVGVPAVFRVSRRGIFLVFETDLTPIVALPRRRRYSAFFAGMAWDTTVLAIALVAELLYRNDVIGLPGLFYRILGAIVLIESFAIAWQWLALFLRNDGYAILANALRCNNLYRATWLTAKARIWRLTAVETAELAQIGEHDRRIAQWFALAYAAGLLAQAWLLLTFGLPYLLGMGRWLFDNLTSLAWTTSTFWLSALLMFVVFGEWLVVPVLAHRERRMRERGELL